MKITRTKQAYNLDMYPQEACALYHCCSEMLNLYKNPDSAPIQLRDAAITNGGFKNWEEAQTMLQDARQEWQGAREILCQDFLRAYSPHLGDSMTYPLPLEARDTLVGMLNERRMFLAYTHSIGQKDLDNLIPLLRNAPKDPRTHAIAELVVLGGVQANIIEQFE